MILNFGSFFSVFSNSKADIVFAERYGKNAGSLDDTLLTHIGKLDLAYFIIIHTNIQKINVMLNRTKVELKIVSYKCATEKIGFSEKFSARLLTFPDFFLVYMKMILQRSAIFSDKTS